MKRVAFYLFWDKDGVVDRYVPYCLNALRSHVDHIVVMVNGTLTVQGRSRLEAVADELWLRENKGFDVGGYQEAIERFGVESLREYDEVILLNYTFFGPIFPFDDMFSESEQWDVDFWGISEHAEMKPNPYVAEPKMPRHIQSHWLAVRRSLFDTYEFRDYWRTMPEINSYVDSVVFHESRFTEYFSNMGYKWKVLCPLSDYPDANPILDDVVSITSNHCPILKRRTFFHDPLYMSDKAIIGRDVLSILNRESNYPVELIWENVARTAVPRIAATNFSLIRIFPDASEVSNAGKKTISELRALVVIHCFYVDMLNEIMDYAQNLPCSRHIVVTTDTQEKKESIQRILHDRAERSFEVRVVQSNDGRDISAFIVGCNDVLREDYDVVVKLHTKKSPQDNATASDWFKRNLFGNLLHSRGYVENLLNLLLTHEEIGMLIPPVVSLGYPTLGHAWYDNKGLAAEMCVKLGINTPLDDATPLAAYGSMFIARPAALMRLLNGGFTWSDFAGSYRDGSLAHVIERLFAYSSLAAGMPVYTVMSSEIAEINYGFLEYRLQDLSQFLPGTCLQQHGYLESKDGIPSILGLSKWLVMSKHPVIARRIRPLYGAVRSVYRATAALVASSREMKTGSRANRFQRAIGKKRR